MKRIVAVMIGVVMFAMVGGAAVEFIESVYRNDSVAALEATQAFTVSYTNISGSKMAIASVFAKSSLATNNWTISVVNGNQTNILSGPTALTYANTGVKYEGYGSVPIGAGGLVQISGTVATNAGGSLVQWQIHLQ